MVFLLQDSLPYPYYTRERKKLARNSLRFEQFLFEVLNFKLESKRIRLENVLEKAPLESMIVKTYAIAVFPVPGCPPIRMALPAIFPSLIMLRITPAALLASTYT